MATKKSTKKKAPVKKGISVTEHLAALGNPDADTWSASDEGLVSDGWWSEWWRTDGRVLFWVCLIGTQFAFWVLVLWLVMT